MVGCRPSVPADCGLNQYCKVTGCAAAGGTCTVKPIPAPGPALVCGCDNVTYWNESVAAHDFGVNITSSGKQCPSNTAAPCNNGKCDGKRSCNLGVSGGNQCGANNTGTCWGLPAICPLGGGQYSQCGGSGSADCDSPCASIRMEQPFYFDNRCPP
jgi:hypothetical protein